MIHGRFGVTGLLVVMSIFIGCRPASHDASDTATSEEAAGPKVTGPAFATARFDGFRQALGSEFTVTDDQGLATFTKAVPPLRVTIRVRHDGKSIRHVAGRVSGPPESGPEMRSAYEQTVTTIAKALGLPVDEAFEQRLGIGGFRTAAGLSYSFYNGLSLFTIKPIAEPARKRSANTKGRPTRSSPGKAAARNVVKNRDKGKKKKNVGANPGPPPVTGIQQEILVVPIRTEEPPTFRPILGSSAAQLAGLVDGFKLQYNIGDREQLYVRIAATHRELIHCKIDAKGQIMWLEALAYDVKGDVDLGGLNRKLWLNLVNLKYDGADPGAARAFLLGPMPKYETDANAEIGSACFCLPICADGKRTRLDIWGIRPPSS